MISVPSWLPWILLAAVLLVAAMAVLMVLLMRRAFLASESTMAQTVSLRMTLLSEQQSRVDDALALQRRDLEAQAQRERDFLESQFQSTVKALEQANLISMNGSTASASQTAKMLATTIGMLGTKDPLAFQQVMPLPDPPSSPEGGVEPYTAVDDVAFAEARRQFFGESETAEAGRRILADLGVVQDGAASSS